MKGKRVGRRSSGLISLRMDFGDCYFFLQIQFVGFLKK